MNKFKNIDTKSLEKIYDGIAMVVEDNKKLIEEVEEPTIIDDLIEYLRIIYEEIEERKRGN